MSFTDCKPWIVTEEDCKRPWSGHPRNFRCYMCGHRFKVGDTVRWQYTNDMKGAGGNPLVCAECDGTPKDVRDRWQARLKEWRSDRFWWFRKEMAQ